MAKKTDEWLTMLEKTVSYLLEMEAQQLKLAETQVRMGKSLAELKNRIEALVRQMNLQIANLIQQLNWLSKVERLAYPWEKGPAEPSSHSGGFGKINDDTEETTMPEWEIMV